MVCGDLGQDPVARIERDDDELGEQSRTRSIERRPHGTRT